MAKTEVKPSNDAYTGILFISLLALIGACVLLYLDYSQYDSRVPPKAPSIEVPKGGPAPAPKGGTPAPMTMERKPQSSESTRTPLVEPEVQTTQRPMIQPPPAAPAPIPPLDVINTPPTPVTTQPTKPTKEDATIVPTKFDLPAPPTLEPTKPVVDVTPKSTPTEPVLLPTLPEPSKPVAPKTEPMNPPSIAPLQPLAPIEPVSKPMENSNQLPPLADPPVSRPFNPLK